MMDNLNDFGIVLAVIGATLAALIPGIASAKAVSKGGIAGAGVITEILPYSERCLFYSFFRYPGIYGLLIAFITFLKLVFWVEAETYLLQRVCFICSLHAYDYRWLYLCHQTV